MDKILFKMCHSSSKASLRQVVEPSSSPTPRVVSFHKLIYRIDRTGLQFFGVHSSRPLTRFLSLRFPLTSNSQNKFGHNCL